MRFVENFAEENYDRNIQINAIAPGILPSKMQDEVLRNENLHKTKDYANALKSVSSGNLDITRILNLCDFLLSESSRGITGKLINAEWDNWREWTNHLNALQKSDLYTLRRIIGRDRGQDWGDF